MPSAGIIDDLVVATISPLETTSKGGLITPRETFWTPPRRPVGSDSLGPNFFALGSSPVVAATSLPPSLGPDPAHRQDSRGRQNEIGCPIPLGRCFVVCLVR
nr:hypothetical protein Iba_chr03eCG11240 [Ipomoea batatas]